MNAHPARRPLALAASAAALLLAGACGAPGSSQGASPSPGGTGAQAPVTATCEPVPGDQLVVLEDDQHLQTVDNVIPAVNAEAAAADPGLVPLLDQVSAALDTDALISLNKAVDVDRRSSQEVAAEWVASAGITPGVTGPAQGAAVQVGAADFAESATLGNIYAAVLREAGYQADVVTIGNRETYLPALEAGDQVQVVPEYVGTLAEFINRDVNGADAEPVASGDLDATVDALTSLGQQVGLTFGAPSAAQDQNAFAVTQAFAQEHDLTTLSDLADACEGLVLGAGPECTERPFCQPGLEETYGLTFSDFRSLDAGGPLTKAALRSGEITLGLVFSSDGSLATD
ncbi:glycine/betaine ABC transporter substrate-binding protein [Xylanimonas oleitrophica]|uniref:Glycine/betaine ABC transporter substrate-binding protein n=1 Tax=Xylanimonas oleitrophica TaxID=2607479 RepID=A0A2W5WVH8_9MICO|nr:glycine betaine ABC transporter substrate-binding protein [Xylanimonas oleitrophica]PZR55170.1 glycine/betaine ABC transporter substrate-binding protein [Xylanimonas oleitrophica]